MKFFQCVACKQRFESFGEHGFGRYTDCREDGRRKGAWGRRGKYCRECSGKQWIKWLRTHDKAILYLVNRLVLTPTQHVIAANLGRYKAEEIAKAALNARGTFALYEWVASDWLGGFFTHCYVQTSFHNMAGCDGRRDAWFWGPDGHQWWGVSIGWGDICRFKKTKETNGVGWDKERRQSALFRC